jgi:hypothetical protein
LSGAWELERPSVLVCILTRELVTTAWSKGFKDLQIPGGGTYAFFSGMPFDHARNMACERALEHGFQWLFFLDDDVIPPVDTIQRLINNGGDIVSGLYYRRAEPIVPVMIMEKNNERVWVTDFKPGATLSVDMVGAGCLLIHRRVLESVSKPWFEWLLDRPDLPENQRCSEDFAFCRKAKQHGFQVQVNTSVTCKHAGIGASEIGGHFKPLSV